MELYHLNWACRTRLANKSTARKYYRAMIALLKVGYNEHPATSIFLGIKQLAVSGTQLSLFAPHYSFMFICIVKFNLLSVFLPAVTQQNHQENSHQCNTSYCYLQLFKIIRMLETQAYFDLFQISFNIHLLFAVPFCQMIIHVFGIIH